MTPIKITEADDPRIAAYRNVRERDLVGRDGCFVAEGEVVLRLLLQSRLHRPLSVLIAEKRWPQLANLLQGCASPVYVAEQEVLDGIVGFELHRGILAIGRAAERQTAEDLLAALGPQALVVCLFGIGNHDNMGGLFRNAAAFGVDAVLLSPDCCNPLYRKAIRVSVGAALTTQFAWFASGQDPVAAVQSHGFQALALSPAGARTLGETERAGRTAVLFGSEGPGLSSEVMSRTTTVRIPMAGGFDSLNVATSSGIVLHHLFTQAEHRLGSQATRQN